MKLRKNNKKGFTIVELVIVIGVIGILSAILIPTFVSLNGQAQNAALKSDLAAVYSSYVADAADGYVGDDKTKPLAMYGQSQVALVKKGDEAKTTEVFYVYSTDNTGWDIVARTKTNAKADASALTTVEYGGYLVYHRSL